MFETAARGTTWTLPVPLIESPYLLGYFRQHQGGVRVFGLAQRNADGLVPAA
jgi:hypothetical protein